MRLPVRHVPLVLLLLLAAAAVAGCGGTGASGDERSGGSGQPSPQAEVDEDSDVAEDDADAPTPAAIADGKRFEQLVAAFGPVSDRINFLVAAETLRADAVDSNAGDDIERERAGVVRIELVRMRDVLAKARPRVAAVGVRTAEQQQVQQFLLEAIDTRLRSTRELEAAIQAVGSDLGDSVVEERFATWRASWDASIRATREATTLMQAARAELGLEPAPEESLR